jgi:hypothetical protein
VGLTDVSIAMLLWLRSAPAPALVRDNLAVDRAHQTLGCFSDCEIVSHSRPGRAVLVWDGFADKAPIVFGLRRSVVGGQNRELQPRDLRLSKVATVTYLGPYLLL